MISGPIFQALRGLVDNRCYPSTFPQPPAVPEWPAIRYTISADANPDLCGTDDGSGDNFTVQFDCVGKTYGAADTLRDQVVAVLMDFDPPARREFENETYDTETKTHRVILVYSLHPSYIGPLQVVCREVVAVLDVCDVSTPIANAATDESAGISDAASAGVELLVEVSETTAAVATDVIEPAMLESAVIADMATNVSGLSAEIIEAATASDDCAAGGVATVAEQSEATVLGDSSASLWITQTTRSEASAISDASDAEIAAALVVSWLSISEEGATPRMFVAWAQIRLPEFAGTRVHVSWAQIETPVLLEIDSVSESAAIADGCDLATVAFSSWAQIEIPEP